MIFENRARSALVKYSILLLIKDMGLDDSWAQIGTIFIENWKRDESHIYFRAQGFFQTLFYVRIPVEISFKIQSKTAFILLLNVLVKIYIIDNQKANI